MIVEVVAVGTELLLGEIVNSNVAVIGRRLADEGFDVHYHVTVGDNLERLTATIRRAVDRADAVVVTGGIGPTQDDLTREALCVVGGRAMVRDAAHAESIRRRITGAGGTVSDTTLRMADHPAGTETLPNRNGVALGVAMEHEGAMLYALPGVPSEMAAMLDEQVLPRLRARAGTSAALRSRLLRTWGWGESRVADALDDLYASANPSIAFLVDGVEVRVRISAKAADHATADAMIDDVDAEVRRRLGPILFGRDDDTVELLLATQLRARGWRLATVEVCTRGGVATTLAALGGDVFAGGLVVPERPTDPADLEIAADGLLARGARTLDADVVLAVSDTEGGLDRRQSPRSVAIAVRTPERRQIRTVMLLGDAARVREYARGTALHHARLAVAGSPSTG